MLDLGSRELDLTPDLSRGFPWVRRRSPSIDRGGTSSIAHQLGAAAGLAPFTDSVARIKRYGR